MSSQAAHFSAPPFVPVFSNPHLLTIAGNYWSRPTDGDRFPTEDRLYSTDDGAQVLVHSQQPEGAPRANLILVHGLEGSSGAGYKRSLTAAALLAGYAVHRFNMRSCGGTEALCGRTLYHSGQTGDLLEVVRELSRNDLPIYLTGFSLGGNVVLKLAGELGAKAIGMIAGVCAVSTPIDLAACAQNLKKISNHLYSNRFLKRLKARVRLKEKLLPGTFDVSILDSIRSVEEFDDRVTAPSFGFGTAANYYATQSAGRFLGQIRVPALLIQAQDDPMIPFAVYDHPAFRENPNLTLLAPEHGGHLGFISRNRPRFWIDGVIVSWLEQIGNKAAQLTVS